MSDQSSVILYGARDFPIDLPKITHRPNGLDSVTQLFQSSSRHAFAKGGRFPGLPNFWITESEPTVEIEGMAYEIRVRGEGLASGEDAQEDLEIVNADEGWDQGPLSILTLHPERFQRGQQHPHIPTMWLMETKKKRVAGSRNGIDGVWRVSGEYRGILLGTDGLPKGRKRRITVGNQVFSSSSTMQLLGPFVDETGAFTGWPSYRFTALDTSRVQVADTFLTWSEPPTDKLPGHLTPENAPPVFDVFGSVWYVESNFAWNWPWGWALKSISSEPLLYGMVGTPYLTTIVTEFVPRAVPK